MAADRGYFVHELPNHVISTYNAKHPTVTVRISSEVGGVCGAPFFLLPERTEGARSKVESSSRRSSAFQKFLGSHLWARDVAVGKVVIREDERKVHVASLIREDEGERVRRQSLYGRRLLPTLPTC